MGELLRLTWDCVDISPVSIEQGDRNLYVAKVPCGGYSQSTPLLCKLSVHYSVRLTPK